MGKINKNLPKKPKTIKKYNLKDCCVKLERINVEKYREKRSTYNIDVKIRNDVCTVGGKKVILADGKRGINIGLAIRLNEAIVTCCNLIETTERQNTLVKCQAKTLNQLIDAEWRKSKTVGEKIEIGHIVLAKMKGYTPWPGVVRSFTKNGKRAQLYFFGTDNSGTVDVDEIVGFDVGRETTRLLLLRRINFFTKAVLEAERLLNIGPEFSITKEQNCLT